MQSSHKLNDDIKLEPVTQAEKLEQSMNLVVEVITFVSAIAFTNATAQFILKPGSFELKDISNITLNAGLVFVTVIATLLRFYHGNMMTLKCDYSKHNVLRGRVKNYMLMIDFVALVLQSLIFVALGFAQSNLYYVYYLFIILLIMDALWYLIREPVGGQGLTWQRPQTRWGVVNLIMGFTLFAFIAVLSNNPALGAPILFSVIMVNLLLDYFLNWRFYFPTTHATSQKVNIFLSAAFTKRRGSNGKVNPVYQRHLDNLMRALRDHAYSIYSAHIEEDWGDKLATPDKYVPRDFKYLLRSHLLVAFIDDNQEISDSVILEIGMAAAMNKALLIIVASNVHSRLGDFIKNLHEFCSLVAVKQYDDFDAFLNNFNVETRDFFKELLQK